MQNFLSWFSLAFGILMFCIHANRVNAVCAFRDREVSVAASFPLIQQGNAWHVAKCRIIWSSFHCHASLRQEPHGSQLWTALESWFPVAPWPFGPRTWEASSGPMATKIKPNPWRDSVTGTVDDLCCWKTQWSKAVVYEYGANISDFWQVPCDKIHFVRATTVRSWFSKMPNEF